MKILLYLHFLFGFPPVPYAFYPVNNLLWRGGHEVLLLGKPGAIVKACAELYKGCSEDHFFRFTVAVHALT